MKIHEYQAMELFKSYGIPVLPQNTVDAPALALKSAEELGGKVVVKAQVLAGGRGKAGGVKLASSAAEAEEAARNILSMSIKSMPVKKVIIVKAAKIKQEYYLGLTVDRAAKRIVYIISASGGVEIEKLAVDEPEKICRLAIGPEGGIDENELRKFLGKIFVHEKCLRQAVDIALKMRKLFVEKDCSLVEINPLVRIEDGAIVACDAKVNFDDNGIFRHPEIEKLRNPEEYSAEEIEARNSGLSYVSMDGDIGCMVNGAGLAMATMDMIKLFNGEPANFLDVGGSSNPKKVLDALRILSSNKKVKAILINIFGGITRCDDVSKGILMAREELKLDLPIVIRLIGTNEKEARKLLEDKGLIALNSMTEAVEKVVNISKG